MYVVWLFHLVIYLLFSFSIEQKTFSWAGIASKNAGTSSVQVSATSPPFGKIPQSIPPRQDMKPEIGAPAPGSGPQPQRQARYKIRTLICMYSKLK